MSSAPNVLRVNKAEEQVSLLDANHEIIRRIVAEHGVTLIQIAEAIDCTVQTISNALNKRSVLSQAHLMRLGHVYGPEALNPVARLSGGRMVAIEIGEAADVLPAVTEVIHELVRAGSPGCALSHQKLLAMAPKIDAAISALEALRSRADLLRSAA